MTAMRDYQELLTRIEQRLRDDLDGLQHIRSLLDGEAIAPLWADLVGLSWWALATVGHLRRELSGEPQGYRAQVSVVELAGALGFKEE